MPDETSSPPGQSRATVYLLVGVYGAAALVALSFFYFYSWIFVFALMPACLIAFQGIYLTIGRSAKLQSPTEPLKTSDRPEPRQNGGKKTEESYCSSREEILLKVRKQARQEVNRQYGSWLISLDYFIPAGLSAIVGVLEAWVLYHSPPSSDANAVGPILDGAVSATMIHEGAIFGALGAYTYVMITLGRRTLQRDVTPGAAVWSTVQLLLGPVLGGVMAAALDPSAGAPSETFKRVAIYFFVGLFPLEIVGIIQSTVRRFFGIQAVTPKLIPLQQIRGVTATIEERLFEEGITDGYQLAMANPIRLQRNTPFDMRQILSWMDECLLYSFVPEWAEVLQKNGFPGVVDFAYFWETIKDNPRDETLDVLAQRLGAEPKLLSEVLRRLNQDAQVQLIWFIYQYPDELVSENAT